MYLDNFRLKTRTSVEELSKKTGISMFRLSEILSMKDIGTQEELGMIMFFLRTKSTKCGI